MKLKSILFTTLCSLMIGASFTACSDDDDENEIIVDPLEATYILCEGSWGGNNACITYINSYDATAFMASDIYLKQNGTKMGDLANAMAYEDGNIYVVMNGSKYVMRLDKNCVEQVRHAFTADEGAPRCIDVEDGYVYVTQYGGKVSKLDAKTLEVVATFNGGDNLEGIVEEDGKLYVANSYKVDGSGNYIYNKEVLVINAKTMKQESTLTVVENPDKIFEIDDKIYLLSKGNYEKEDSPLYVAPALQVIDPKSNSVKRITNAGKITEGHNGLIYCVRSAYDENWNMTNTFFTYNPSTGAVNETSFLQNAPASFASAAIYLLEVDESTGYIYVGTSDYVTNGTIYRFDKNGNLQDSFDAGGINPSTMIFVD